MTSNDSDNRKKVLVLCTSHNDLGVVLALKKMGYHIIATGNRPNSPGEKYVDEWIPMDYSNKEAILELSERLGIDAICQCCNDYGVYTAAYVAEKMHLPGYDDYDTTLLLHNKDRFRKYADMNGLPTPSAHHFSDRSAAYSWAVANDLYPLIVKPSDASAGNGITKVSSAEEMGDAIDYAFANTRNGVIVIEEYVEGTQHGFCSFLIGKKVRAIASNNEYSIVNPYRVEIDTYPATTSECVEKQLVGIVEGIAEDLNLSDGIFHMQYIFSNNRIYIIEVMRRVLGNMYSVPANRLNNMDWDYWECRAKTGLNMDGFPLSVSQEGYYAYKAILADHNGTIQNVVIHDDLKKHVFYEYRIWSEGYTVTSHLSQPLGFIFMIFDSYDEMDDVLIKGYGGVEITYSNGG